AGDEVVASKLFESAQRDRRTVAATVADRKARRKRLDGRETAGICGHRELSASRQYVHKGLCLPVSTGPSARVRANAAVRFESLSPANQHNMADAVGRILRAQERDTHHIVVELAIRDARFLKPMFSDPVVLNNRSIGKRSGRI